MQLFNSSFHRVRLTKCLCSIGDLRDDAQIWFCAGHSDYCLLLFINH